MCKISWAAATATAGGLGGRAELQGQLDQVSLLVLHLGQIQGQVDLQNIGLSQTHWGLNNITTFCTHFE
jgi:hypothetical protein